MAWLEKNDISQETALNQLSSEDLNQLHRNFENEKRDSGIRRKPKEKGGEGEREN